MIDLSPMKKVVVDPARREAIAEPGVLWGEFDRAAESHGLALLLSCVAPITAVDTTLSRMGAPTTEEPANPATKADITPGPWVQSSTAGTSEFTSWGRCV